jgi:hypothetical protein
MMEEEKTIITRKLRGTPFLVAVELDMVQYQHFLMATGRQPTVSMPMDIQVMREVSALVTCSDEVRDAAKMAGG